MAFEPADLPGRTPSPSPPAAIGDIRRVEAVVNPRSGSVRPEAADQLRAVLARLDAEVNLTVAPEGGVVEALRRAVDARPDLLVLLAGDGTAALAAGLCGMDGPLLAPLPGGTMNMLPHALYGRVGWRDALEATLSAGRPRTLSGGEVGGRRFFVAAILGAPALFAEAREALRQRRLQLAITRARGALSRAFVGRLRFQLADGPRRKTEALTLLCPLVSQALDDDTALEAAALDPKGAAEVFRLGFHAVFGAWRQDPCVRTWRCETGQAWAHGRIPLILDGEPHRLSSPLDIRFVAEAFRAFAPPGAPASQAAAVREGERVGADAAGGTVASKAAKVLH